LKNYQIIIYGSYGYTGKLIAEECRQKNLSVLLAGRDEMKLKAQSQLIGYPFQVVKISDHFRLVNLLKQGAIVIHCGGPFQHTCSQMLAACLESQTHYTDITGEYTVFEQLASFDTAAKTAGILVMPGTGFDVVPTDCLAVHLKKRLPSATHLQLAFAMVGGGLSRGTSKTMTEGLGYGGMIRQNGKLTPVMLGKKTMKVDFGKFVVNTLCIPWGDISTAWRSTGIPNIEVYTGMPEKAIRAAKFSNYFNWLLKSRFIKKYVLSQIDKRPAGPSEEIRKKGKSYLWGKAWADNGELAEARLETMNGYSLTAKTTVLIAQKLLNENVRTGYFTPAQYFGEGLIMEVEGTRMEDV
jgi:short subunit dehydrogenase-like uncharacterized protein